jgi:hypothetical protein
MIDLNIALDVKSFLIALQGQLAEDEYDVVLKRVQEYQLSNDMMTAIEFKYYTDGFIDSMLIANMKVDKGLINRGV